MNKKIGFIGCGNMATAILNGMLTSNFTQPENIYIYDLDVAKCDYFANKGVNVSSDTLAVVDSCNIVVLAVKPQNYPDVLSQIKSIECSEKIFVSIAAGISIDYIRQILSFDAKVVRVMPNTPLLISKGASALSPSDNVCEQDFEIIYNIFKLSGVVEVITEEHMNEIIAVNGSSPAFVYLFAKAMCDYADSCGIDKTAALNLICATFEGAALMMKNTDDDIQTLIDKVSSPGGTTIAALNSFEENKFEDIVKKAMQACTDRAEELGK